MALVLLATHSDRRLFEPIPVDAARRDSVPGMFASKVVLKVRDQGSMANMCGIVIIDKFEANQEGASAGREERLV